MKRSQNKSIGFYLSLAAGIIMLLAAVVYLVYSLAVKLFVPSIFVVTLAASLTSFVAAFSGISPLLIIPTVLCMTAFGMYLNDRIEMFVLMASGVYGMSETGAILWIVVLILAMQLAAFVLSLLSCFFLLKKSDNDAENERKKAYYAEKKQCRAALLEHEKEIVSASDVPIRVRMLSASSKAKLALCMAVLMGVSAVLGSVIGNGKKKSEAVPAVAGVETVGLAITQLPDKLQYNEGEFFVPDGMQVALIQSDGKLNPVEGWYTSVDGQPMSQSNREVTVSFQDYSASMKFGVAEAASAGILEGETAKLKFKQNGTVQASVNGSEYRDVGTWRNTGYNVTMNLLGTDSSLTYADGSYSVDYDGDTLSGRLNVLTSLRLGGLSERGEIAGYGIATLNEDGTATVERSSGIMREGTWYATGQTFYVDMDGNVYTGEYYDGEYHLVIEASVAGYSFTYTTSESDLPAAEAQINAAKAPVAEPTPEPEEEAAASEDIFLVLTGEGHGASEGRIATLTLFNDGSSHLEWNFGGRYVLGEYTGTWENAGMGKVSVTIDETDGTQTTYPFNMDASTYSEGYVTLSFTWAKDKDTDPDYNIELSGQYNVEK